MLPAPFSKLIPVRKENVRNHTANILGKVAATIFAFRITSPKPSIREYREYLKDVNAWVSLEEEV